MTDDPRSSQPQPPFEGEQQQPRPGLTSKMHPNPTMAKKATGARASCTPATCQ